MDSRRARAAFCDSDDRRRPRAASVDLLKDARGAAVEKESRRSLALADMDVTESRREPALESASVCPW